VSGTGCLNYNIQQYSYWRPFSAWGMPSLSCAVLVRIYPPPMDWGSTWMPRKKRSTFSVFSRERRRALKKLAGTPRGHTEKLLLAHGFSVEMLRGLVRDGLATVVTEPMMDRPGVTIIVERIRITDAGRRALEE
jgi:hypothetical protein